MIEDIVRDELRNMGSDIEKKAPIRKVEGRVINPKTSIFRKFVNTFVEEDLPDVIQDAKNDVVVPYIKDLLVNGFNYIVEKTFGGSSYGYSSRRPRSSSLVREFERSSLNGGYNYGTRSTKTTKRVTEGRPKFTFDDIVMRDRPAATDLLETLRDYIHDFGQVSVAQLYESVYDDDDVQIQSMDFAYNYYGWKNLDDAHITRVPSGYWINLPRPIQLD